MKTSFQKPGATTPDATIAVEATVAPVNTAVAEPVTTGNTVGTPAPSSSGSQLPATVPQYAPPAAPDTGFHDSEDEMSDNDLVLPRFNIVQKVGDLSTQFEGGTIVLNDGSGGGAYVLAQIAKGKQQSEPGLRVVLIGFKPTIFVEKIEGGVRGRTFKTENEVVAAGGTLDYNESLGENGKPLFQRLATAMVLIQQPAKSEDATVNALFPYEVAGNRYALALWSMKGTSYTNAAKHFKTARKMQPAFRQFGYRASFWTVSSMLKKFNSNFAYIPVVRINEQTTQEFRDALQTLLGF